MRDPCKIAESDYEYSPIAYSGCAEYCKSLGMSYYDEAIKPLSTLISKYRNHEVVHAVRLEIAGVLQFSDFPF
jgi:hypothetical protein